MKQGIIAKVKSVEIVFMNPAAMNETTELKIHTIETIIVIVQYSTAPQIKLVIPDKPSKTPEHTFIFTF